MNKSISEEEKIMKLKIAEILRDNITFSPQINNYVIHGAVEKLYQLIVQQPAPGISSDHKKSAEEILREYVSFEDVNGNDTVELLPLTIVDCMEEYATQSDNKNFEEDKLQKAISIIEDWIKDCDVNTYANKSNLLKNILVYLQQLKEPATSIIK